MSLNSLNIASDGLLNGGAQAAINTAVLGLLRLGDDEDPGAGGGRRRSRRLRVQHISAIIEALHKGRERDKRDKIEAARAEAIEVAEADDMDVEADLLRRASTLKELRAAVAEMSQAANAEIKRQAEADNSRIAREQAIREAHQSAMTQRDAHVSAVLTAERERLEAVRQGYWQADEDIAIALLLAI